jgi:hypothetical protein
MQSESVQSVQIDLPQRPLRQMGQQGERPGGSDWSERAEPCEDDGPVDALLGESGEEIVHRAFPCDGKPHACRGVGTVHDVPHDCVAADHRGHSCSDVSGPVQDGPANGPWSGSEVTHPGVSGEMGRRPTSPGKKRRQFVTCLEENL